MASTLTNRPAMYCQTPADTCARATLTSHLQSACHSSTQQEGSVPLGRCRCPSAFVLTGLCNDDVLQMYWSQMTSACYDVVCIIMCACCEHKDCYIAVHVWARRQIRTTNATFVDLQIYILDGNQLTITNMNHQLQCDKPYFLEWVCGSTDD